MRSSLVAVGLFAALVVMAKTEPASADASPERVAIDAAAVGAPISPLIYGQFIEHLGRCVQGGLWAEMLEDRKFFYPVTGEAPAWEMYTPGSPSWEGEGHPYEILVRSPWMILGDKRAVRMVGEGALPGRPSVELAPAGAKDDAAAKKHGRSAGLMQERLPVRAGRSYVGRIVLAGAATARVEVTLAWGGGIGARQTIVIDRLANGWNTRSLDLHVARDAPGGGTDNGRLEIVARGADAVRVGAV